MKKIFAFLIAVMMVAALTAVFTSAEVTLEDGAEFPIHQVDAVVAGDTTTVITDFTDLAINKWSRYVILSKVSDDLYKVESMNNETGDGEGKGESRVFTLAADQIALAFHSSGTWDADPAGHTGDTLVGTGYPNAEGYTLASLFSADAIADGIWIEIDVDMSAPVAVTWGQKGAAYFDAVSIGTGTISLNAPSTGDDSSAASEDDTSDDSSAASETSSEVSSAAPSSAAPSSSSSGGSKPGDASIAVVAVLAVLALAGAGFAIAKRR